MFALSHVTGLVRNVTKALFGESARRADPWRVVPRLQLLEDKITPASYRVMIENPAAPQGDTLATHVGQLRLIEDRQNYTDPTGPAGYLARHSVTAADPVAAIQLAVAGEIIVTAGGQTAPPHVFSPATSSAVELDHMVFWIKRITPPGPANPVVYEIRMEDLVNLGNPDWDYNDHVWTVRVYDEVADVALPTLGFVDGSNNALANPRVAKWENAFEYQRDAFGAKIPDPDILGGFKTQLKRTTVPGTPPQKFEWDKFIDGDGADDLGDPDRFRVQITDAKANVNPAVVDSFVAKLWTFGEGAYRQVQMTETGVNTGVFRSKSLLLVSDEKDDKHVVKSADLPNGVADDLLGDRTFRVKTLLPGSSGVANRYQIDRLWFSYDYLRTGDAVGASRNSAISAAVLGGTATKTGIVKLHVTILKNEAGTAVTTEAAVKDMIRTANEVYARVGIHFQLSGAISTIALPAGVNFAKAPGGVDQGGVSLGIAPDEEFPSMIPEANEAGKVANSNRTADADDIEVYFVDKLCAYRKVVVPNPAGGFTEHIESTSAPRGIPASASVVQKDTNTAPDSRYRDTVLVSAIGFPVGDDTTAARPYTLAHELGHILTDDAHADSVGVWEVNLMRNGTTNQVGLTDSKRLTAAQQTTIFTAWPNLVNKPYAAGDEV